MKRRRKRLMVIIPFSTMTRLADNVLDVTMFYASGADEDSLEPDRKCSLQSYLMESL